MEKKLTNQILRGIWVILLALAAVVAVYYSIPLLYPFLIGWIIAYLLQPAVRLFERRLRTPRWLAVTSALLLFIGVIGGIVTLLVIRIGNEIQRLAQFIKNNYEEWMNNMDVLIHSDVLQRFTEQITRLYEDSDYQNTVDEGIKSAGQRIADAVSGLLQSLAENMIGFIAALPNIAVGLIVALLAAFFISKDWEKVRSWLYAKMPSQTKIAVGAVWRDLQKALFGFIRAQLILISITAVFVIIGLLLLRVPYAVTIGLLIGLVDLMPYLGTGAVFVPWIVYAFLQGNYTFGIGLTVLYALILVSRQLAEPKIVSSSIGLNPLITLIGLFVGLKLFGFAGLIIGPVILVLLFSFHRAGVFRDIKRFIVHGKYLASE